MVVVKRLGSAFVTLLAISLVVFVLSRMSGDPRELMLSEYATAEDYELLNERLGLDKPYYAQYGVFLADAVRGDLGESIQARQPVLTLILQRLPGTLELAGSAFVAIILASVLLGVATAVWRDTWVETAGNIVAVVGQSVPAFWLGIVLVYVFALTLGWLPMAGRGGWLYLVLPTLTIAANSLAALTRLLSSAMTEAMDAEYVKFANVKSVPPWRVTMVHCLKNAILTPFTYAGIILGQLLTGSIIVETVFGWPGIGLLALQAVQTRDYPLLQGVVLVFAIIYVGIALLVDVAYAYLDPRIRH
ncbi:ABC transporter permease [Amaricoccus solimangrovi]|uniref:ABC transporter permease n=1 Tax=Amaricoccus solimangrovi TaxID=2589815 RepID=A0A501WEK0_9RHOB|nr:ABC transporter permease [Amaricoccus solimangrovi]TPE46504.1 ABC transporter permease [Amaricoccus solimangrovi]